ncbi:MAG: enoyl-CoA hydratase-related protein [Pseudomonadota bacterium]
MAARKVTAGEALQMGLVNQVLPQDSLMSGVREYAKDIAANVSPRSTRVMKQQVYNALMENLGEATDIANVEMVKSLQCDDFKEGVAHFLEKRPAAFTGN